MWTRGWIKLMRSEATGELLRDPKAFALLALIATRARWKDGFNRAGLRPGEALIGDHRTCGLTQKEYRCAKERLAKWQFAAFKGATKGTVATLLSIDVFDVSGNGGASRGANEGRTRGERGATNEKDRLEGKERKTGRGSTRARSLKTASPSQEEVAAYFREKDYISNPVKFFKHHARAGWRGITDWHAGADYWELNEEAHAKRTGNKTVVWKFEAKRTREQAAAEIAEDNRRCLEIGQTTLNRLLNDREEQAP